MTRLYEYGVKVLDAKKNKVRKILEEMEEEVNDYCYEGIIHFGGETRLSDGETEAEAHNRISLAIKKEFPEAKVQTNWTYLEDLPFITYGDDIGI